MPANANLKKLLGQLQSIQKQEITCRNKLTALEIKSLDITTKNTVHPSAIEKRIRQKKWKGLLDTSQQKQRKLLANINSFIELNRTKSLLASQKDNLIKPYLTNLHKPLKKQANWPALKEELIIALKKKNKKTKTINNYINFLESFDYKKSLKLTNQISEKQNERIQQSADRWFAAFAKEYYTNIAASVNLNELPHRTTSQIKANHKQAAKLCSDHWVALKKIFTATPGQQKKQLEGIFSKTDAMIQKLLPCALSLYKQSISNKHSIASIDDISIENGSLIRELLLIIMASKKIAYVLTNPNTKIYNDWVQASKKTTITYKEPKVQLVTIDNLKKQGSKYNNKLIKVKGKITRVKITHKFRKVISYAFITNGKNEIRITLPHIKIDSGGMVLGSYAQVTGKWLQKNKESYDKPSLALDRISYSTLSKTHWPSWVALQLNNIYEANPHSLNIQHSWKPGSNGAINPIKYSLI